MERDRIILVDTNIIIEAVRAGCWNALTGWFRIVTTEVCRDESLAGDPLRRSYIAVTDEDLARCHQIVAVDMQAHAQFALACAGADALDLGERDLFVHALNREDDWIICCADRAAVNIALGLGWEPRIEALESLTVATGARPTLENHFSSKWLAGVRSDWKLRNM